MKYVEVSFSIIPFEPWNEIIIANLSILPYESFMEEGEYLKAYIQEQDFDPLDLKDLVLKLKTNKGVIINYEYKNIEQQNWNHVWESYFEPVSINDQLHILAPFHPKDKYQGLIIEIEPKMSFGTGHHQTTFLMCEEISSLSLDGKNVLDMGSGTGVLAILAEKCGAKDILAIDIESWSVENCEENTKRNKCSKIISKLGDIIDINGQYFDIIIANINKNVLLGHLPSYSKCLNTNGILLLSGFFESDAEDLISAAFKESLVLKSKKNKDGWTILSFKKNKQFVISANKNFKFEHN
jgi:ribosomal protein L11 methyltransferase